jgi:hypothetical protein
MTTDPLKEVLVKYSQPDPSQVSLLPRYSGRRDVPKQQRQRSKCDECGGFHEMPAIHLSYVGHAEITRILIEIDSLWNWQPLEVRDGAPVINIRDGIATMWGTVTLLGKSIIGVGSCAADKDDREKELIGDLLRNASMRFGIALGLWSKAQATELKQGNEPKRPPEPGKRSAPRQQTVNGKVNKALAIVLEKSASKEGDPLEVISRIVGRPLEAITDLTTEEAKQALESLAKTTTEEEPF